MNERQTRPGGMANKLWASRSNPSLLPILIVLAGITLPIARLAFRGPDWLAGGEALNAAIGFARNGPNQGTTAHVSPISTRPQRVSTQPGSDPRSARSSS